VAVAVAGWQWHHRIGSVIPSILIGEKVEIGAHSRKKKCKKKKNRGRMVKKKGEKRRKTNKNSAQHMWQGGSGTIEISVSFRAF
jgi:hypothetical protein